MREDELIAYPQDRAAAVAGVSQRMVRYWDRMGLVQPQVRRRLSPRNVVRLYNFQDMLSLLVAAELRRHRFSLQRVRKAVAHLRSRGYQEPLTELRFATAGKEIYFQHADGEWEGDLSRDQMIFHSVIDLDMIRAKIREGVQRPASAHGKVEKRRGSLGNKPVFAGSRIPVATVTGWLAEGFSDDQVIEEYPDLTPADLRAARALWTSAWSCSSFSTTTWQSPWAAPCEGQAAGA